VGEQPLRFTRNALQGGVTATADAMWTQNHAGWLVRATATVQAHAQTAQQGYELHSGRGALHRSNEGRSGLALDPEQFFRTPTSAVRSDGNRRTRAA